MSDKTVRYEPFGGIIGLNEPPALVFVDKDYMRELGYEDSPLWKENAKYLTAPTEVHFSITNICNLNCRHCTSGSGKEMENEVTTEQIKKAIDILAEMKVFHIALGGGELFLRPDAIEVAKYARSKGIVPNATTNGYYMTPELAKECTVFGQINISIDGIGDNYGVVRGTNIFEHADKAVRMLVEAGVNTGVNCMATSANFDRLEEVVAYADSLNLKEVLFLRLKPSGRALEIYNEFKLTHQQNKKFFKFIMKMAKKYKPNIQVDCSFVPNLCYGKPSKKTMRMLGVEGCEGGNVLLGMRPDGWINACSHYREYFPDIFELKKLWHEHKHFKQFRERNVSEEACKKCTYVDLCHGGCPLFSEYLKGDFNVPDPECPILIENEIKLSTKK